MQSLSIIIFRNSDGSILLQFRDSDAKNSPLMWSFFGGTIEQGETPHEAVIREVQEELALYITEKDVQLLTSIEWTGSTSSIKKTVHLFEALAPVKWGQFSVHEGAGAAFFTKEEIASLPSATELCTTLVNLHC